MSPALSTPAPHLSNHQLCHQAALILDATSPGKSDRTRSLLPLKVPGTPEAHVLPVEACVPPKPLGSLEADVPPKPQGPLADPSCPTAGPSQAKYSLTPSDQVWSVDMDGSLLKHTHYIAKLSKLAMATLSTHHPALPSLDISHLETSRLASTLPHEFPSFTGVEDNSEDDSGKESCSFDALISTCYKKVANGIQPVWMTLPEEYCIVQRIPSDPLLSLPILPTHPPNFILSKKFTQECREKMNIMTSGFLWPDEEKLVLFLIKAQE